MPSATSRTAVNDVAQGAERQVKLVESTRTAVQEAARAASASAVTALATSRGRRERPPRRR